ncbi:MAG: hypothetical protein N3A01_08640 [Bacteroidales bacterium]|nr:hypothetical protein [Bacteroidales bacterium]
MRKLFVPSNKNFSINAFFIASTEVSIAIKGVIPIVIIDIVKVVRILLDLKCIDILIFSSKM